MSAMLGVNDFNAEMFSTKMEDMLAVIHQVNEQFRDPVIKNFFLIAFFLAVAKILLIFPWIARAIAFLDLKYLTSISFYIDFYPKRRNLSRAVCLHLLRESFLHSSWELGCLITKWSTPNLCSLISKLVSQFFVDF